MNAWLKRLVFGRTLKGLLCISLLALPLSIPCHADVWEPFCICTNAEITLPEGVFFFGESTTAHLARRGGVMDCDGLREHVLRDESGTRRLDRRILSSPVLLQTNGVPRSVCLKEALQVLTPDVLVLSFGLNGLVQFSKAPDCFLEDYRALIDGVHRASPHTRILIQSIYPVSKNDAFASDPQTINEQIHTLNVALATLQTEYSFVRFTDTAALLKSGSGALRAAYDNGDGIHLTNDAYRILLAHIVKEIHTWNLEVDS